MRGWRRAPLADPRFQQLVIGFQFPLKAEARLPRQPRGRQQQ
jgi:hypothetical protein